MMKKKFIFVLASTACMLSACQLNPTQHHENLSLEKDQLSSYLWQYQPNQKIAALQLNFDKAGGLFIQTPCNNQSGTWQQQDATHFSTSNLASTMKMCAPEQMQLERWSAQLLSNQKLKYAVAGSKDAATLTLTDSKGQQYQFKGQLKPEIQYQSQAQTVFFEISPKAVQNSNDLQVREIRYDANGLKQPITDTWHVLKQPIQGYQHDPKLAQIIRVKKYTSAQGDVFIYDMTVEQSMTTP
ncbi:META domain-containing protein [Acinetobacter sp. MD2]|uniref:META domain-containing protein n=1 Tax=Acinetobacter sp. MD2 TaxID=2600066 RepID=UPI002D1F0138|nr:META domain-containing protein [Acinetobacter sp. MD2]MEB3767248.1 META domain-containing protein [Acinetobacter sp. MD2]